LINEILSGPGDWLNCGGRRRAESEEDEDRAFDYVDVEKQR